MGSFASSLHVRSDEANQVVSAIQKVIGAQPFFANPSYRYLEECTEADLQEAGMRMIARLRFRMHAISG